jgi:signal transduction histidine kinase
MGLSPEQVAALFQPFNRLGQESGPQEGTGIGLVVTRRLIELMGGEIGVTAAPASAACSGSSWRAPPENTGPFRAARCGASPCRRCRPAAPRTACCI